MYHGKVLGKIKKFLGKSKFLGKIKKDYWENQKVLGKIKKVLGKIKSS